MIRLFLLAILVTLFACEKSNDENFVFAYAELRIAAQEYGETEDGKAIRHQILQSRRLSADVFEKKIGEIKKEPEKWLKFQNKLIKVLDSIANNLNNEDET